MISLFISTATNRIIVSLIKDDKILYNFNEQNGNTLSERIMPVIDEGLKNNNLDIKDIDNYYVVTGPGSFTGIRVGLTIAKTASWALNKKIIPISSLELLASNNISGKILVPLIDARRDYVYCGKYDDKLDKHMEEKHMLLNDLLKIVENDNPIFISEDEFEFSTAKPEYDILKIINKHKNDPFLNPHSVNPNYLKLTEAEEKFNDNSNK